MCRPLFEVVDSEWHSIGSLTIDHETHDQQINNSSYGPCSEQGAALDVSKDVNFDNQPLVVESNETINLHRPRPVGWGRQQTCPALLNSLAQRCHQMLHRRQNLRFRPRQLPNFTLQPAI